jgi:Amt family ammonium transporter
MGDAYTGAYKAIAWTGIPLYAKFFFQLVFAGTAATIVSGSVAERIKYFSFIVFAFLLVAFVYPVTGHWIWGGGWLSTAGFWDFAVSTVVHRRRRLGRTRGHPGPGAPPGQVRAWRKSQSHPAHSMTSGVIGCFVLWLGWFRVQSRLDDGGGPECHLAYFHDDQHGRLHGPAVGDRAQLDVGRKPDLGMSVNGCLAGLVAITAPCAFVTVGSSLIIGLLAGLLVVCAVKLLDRLQIDDPVGAVPVHLFNGVFGTICVGLFAVDKITGAATGNGLFNGGGATLLDCPTQGHRRGGAYTLVASFVFWYLIQDGGRPSREQGRGRRRPGHWRARPGRLHGFQQLVRLGRAS